MALKTVINTSFSGPTFGVIHDEYPELVDNLVTVCDVYARMSPDQKQLLVNRLQQVDYTVAMCGDGANDCAALKVSHFSSRVFRLLRLARESSLTVEV